MANLDADIAHFAADRRGQDQPIGARKLRPLLSERRSLGKQNRARSTGLERPLSYLRLGRAQGLALADQALGDRLHFGATGEESRAAVLYLALRAGPLPCQLHSAPRCGLGEPDLARGDAALALQGLDRRRETLSLLREPSALGRTDVRGEVDLTAQFRILVADLGKLTGNAVPALRERQGDQRRARCDDLAVADVNFSDFRLGRRIDARDPRVIGDDPANLRAGCIAAEDQDRDDDGRDAKEEACVEAGRRRDRCDDRAG